MKCRSKGRPKAKSPAGGPGRSAKGKNLIPAQLTNLHFYDKKKEKKAGVKNSPTIELKNVKAVVDSLARLQLEEKNPSPAFYKEEKNPKCIVEPRIVSEFLSSCPICTKFGHTPEQCFWMRHLIFDVTQVGKGYEIYGWHVHILWCSFCDEIGHHRTLECPKPDKKNETTRLWKEFFFPEDKDG
ncbi:unnamed protein product [Malus baccata var. baccata]